MRGKVVFGKPIRYYVDGAEVTKAEFDLAFPSKGVKSVNTLMQTSKAWPRLSDSLGIHPKQKKSAEESLRRHGIPTEFDSKGRAIIRDNAHQRDLMRAMNVVNHDGGYGSVTG